jgi:hypothetical protein
VSESEVPDERVDQFIVYGAYGEVMHQFQVFELTLWGFLTRGIKPGMSESQAFDKVTKWDGTTLGALVRGLKSQGHWPEGMVEPLEQAVETRNYLAHHFLREYFVVAPSEKVKKQATEQLANVSTRLEDLQRRWRLISVRLVSRVSRNLTRRLRPRSTSSGQRSGWTSRAE